MESCLSSCPSPWSEGLCASMSRSLWPGAVDAAAVEKTDCSGGPLSQIDRMLENLIMGASANRSAGEVKQCEYSNNANAASKDMALPHPLRRNGGAPSFKRSAAAATTAPSSALCAAAAAALASSKNNVDSFAAAARVRARRGEATDKHSISERTRRTKISDRMRALHKLIPEASKTNKACMLDEVIHYVSMLQARLKVECMKKLDGRADSSPPMSMQSSTTDKEGWRRSCNRMYVNRMIERVLDPLEDRLAEAERQVMTRLAHPSHDLSLVTAYLHSAGLSLLPISHLSSIAPITANDTRARL